MDGTPKFPFGGVDGPLHSAKKRTAGLLKNASVVPEERLRIPHRFIGRYGLVEQMMNPVKTDEIRASDAFQPSLRDYFVSDPTSQPGMAGLLSIVPMGLIQQSHRGEALGKLIAHAPHN